MVSNSFSHFQILSPFLLALPLFLLLVACLPVHEVGGGDAVHADGLPVLQVRAQVVQA